MTRSAFFRSIDNMIQKENILTFINDKKPELIKKYRLTKIGIFGSFARNEQGELSDIDLIVEFEKDTQNLYQLKQALKKLFQTQFNKEVDICREKYIKPYYKKQILRDAIFV